MDAEQQAAEFADRVLETMGPSETLLMAMRLVLLVGQRAGDNEAVVEAAKDAMEAIRRLGEASDVFPLPS